MSTIAKVFVVLNLLLAVAFLGAAATFLGYVDSYRGKYTDEQKAHDTTRTNKDKVIADRDAEVAKLKGEVSAAQLEKATATDRETVTARAYNELKTAYDSVSASHTRLTASSTVAQDTIKGLTELKEQLQTNAAALREAARLAQDERGAAVKAMNQAQLDLQNATGTIKELEQKLATVQEALDRAQFAREAGIRGTGAPTGTGEVQPMQNAKVTASDGRTNIVVISIGSEDGVKVGYRYVVSRGSTYVGMIEVTSTEAKQSAARSIRDLQKSEIRVGDDVASQ
jgi:hypothetical protein